MPLTASAAPRSSGAHGWDISLFLDVNHLARRTGWMHAPMLAYAVDVVTVMFALLLVAGWWRSRQRRDAAAMAACLWAGAGVLAARGIAQLVNHNLAEARPWQILPHALILAGHPTTSSFPSYDAVMAGAVTAGLFLVSRRLGIIAAAAAVLLCFGRVYIGAHYPHDVAAGLLLGAAVVLAGDLIVRIPLAATVRLASRSPLRILLTAGPGAVPEAAGIAGTAGSYPGPPWRATRRPHAGRPAPRHDPDDVITGSDQQRAMW